MTLDNFLNENGKDQTDKSNEYIRNIYQIILESGKKGIEYREIISKLKLKQKEKQNFVNYMLSHYCRKLVNYGMIVVSSKMINKGTNIRIAKCR